MKNSRFKFRAWAKESKNMLSNERLKEMQIFVLSDDFAKYIDNFLILPIQDKYPLMQYTGLKDKNGVEIYEGDIIKLYGLPNAHFQVVFKNQYIGGWILMHKKNEVSLGARDKNELKVVGNIYENPELLEEG